MLFVLLFLCHIQFLIPFNLFMIRWLSQENCRSSRLQGHAKHTQQTREINPRRDRMKVLITSALPYVYGPPHLGNMAGSILPADVWHRYLKLAGVETIAICGSDEHGATLELEALRRGLDPRKFATKCHNSVKNIIEKFGCKFTFYGRTHSNGNKKTVFEIFNTLRKRGYIIEEETTLPYCLHCKKFLPDRFIEGKCPFCGGLGRGDQCNDCSRLLEPAMLESPYCTLCGGKEIEFRKEKHLFFDLGKIQSKIERWMKANPHWPENAKALSAEFLKRGLKTWCITRDITWGFKVPLKNYTKKVFYSWFDAPIGYIGITREWSKKIGKTNEWMRWWKGKTRIVHFIGKDNITFHTIFWPAILIGGSDFTLPYKIQSYEFLVGKAGIKFSRSLGVGLNTPDALKMLPADYWRYVLIMLLPETADSEFSWESFRAFVNTELNDTLGNFVHRTLVFVKKYFGGRMPKPGKLDDTDKAALREAERLAKDYKRAMDDIKLRDGLRAAMAVARVGNAYLSKKEPWKLMKKDKVAAATCIYVAANIVKEVAILISPFIPSSAAKIWTMLGLKNFEKVSLRDTKVKLKPGQKIGTVVPLFGKISDEKLTTFKYKFGG